MCNSFLGPKTLKWGFRLEMAWQSIFFKTGRMVEIEKKFIFYILLFLLAWHLLLYMVWYWYLETSAFLHLACLSFFLPCQIKNTKYKHTNTQIHKYTNIQIHKYTNIQTHKYTNTQIFVVGTLKFGQLTQPFVVRGIFFKYTNIQIYKYTNTQISWSLIIMIIIRVNLTYRVKSAHKLKLTDKQLLQWTLPVILIMVGVNNVQQSCFQQLSFAKVIYLSTWTISDPPNTVDVELER